MFLSTIIVVLLHSDETSLAYLETKVVGCDLNVGGNSDETGNWLASTNPTPLVNSSQNRGQ